MSWKSVRPEFAMRLALSLVALAFLALAIFLIHKSATAPRTGVSYSNSIILCNVIAAASLSGTIVIARSGTPVSTLRIVVALLAFVLLVATQLLLDAHLYSLFGGRFYT